MEVFISKIRALHFNQVILFRHSGSLHSPKLIKLFSLSMEPLHSCMIFMTDWNASRLAIIVLSHFTFCDLES